MATTNRNIHGITRSRAPSPASSTTQASIEELESLLKPFAPPPEHLGELAGRLFSPNNIIKKHKKRQ